MIAATAVLAFGITACESDTAKLQRLQRDQAVNCLLAQKYGQEYSLVMLQVKTPLQDSLARMSTDYRTKCDLAQRELNRFMR